MRHEQAEALVAVLLAAFPYPRVPDLTVELYCQRLAQLHDVDAATEAVNAIADGEERWPTLKLILREYDTRAKRNRDRLAYERGLDEGPPDPNALARVREIQAVIQRAIDERSRSAGLVKQDGNGNDDAGARRPKGGPK
jgi:hypothetical protein